MVGAQGLRHTRNPHSLRNVAKGLLHHALHIRPARSLRRIEPNALVHFPSPSWVSEGSTAACFVGSDIGLNVAAAVNDIVRLFHNLGHAILAYVPGYDLLNQIAWCGLSLLVCICINRGTTAVTVRLVDALPDALLGDMVGVTTLRSRRCRL